MQLAKVESNKSGHGLTERMGLGINNSSLVSGVTTYTAVSGKKIHDQNDACFAVTLPAQDHFIEYPILVQTTYHPKRNQILVSNLTLN
jgi:hypothetical protein